MRRTATVAFLLANLLTAQKHAENLLQQALEKERGQSDIKGAIVLFQQIAADKNTSRPVAARALLEAVRCQKKLNTAGVRHLWTTRGAGHTGSLSPDGRYLSFIEWSSGDLVIRDLQSNTTRVLAPSVRAGVSRFSPDGKQIAFDGAELRLINADGTGLRTIAKSQFQLLAWTPDGKHLAVNAFDALNLIAIATGQKREILKGSQWKPTNGLRFSPNGQWIAFTNMEGMNRAIYVMPATGGAPRLLAPKPTFDRDPMWSPDGQSIYFLANRGGGGLWQVPLNSGEPKLVRTDPAYTVDAIARTANGSLIYTLAIGASDVYSVPFDFAIGKVTGPPEVFSTREPGSKMYPNLSADGKRMVWGTMDQPKAYLTIHDMATRDEKRFPVRLGSFALQSPITNRILIRSQEPKLNLKDFFSMDPNTGATTPFLSVNNMHVHYSLSATFSHDEKEFYYLDPFSKYPGNVVMAMNIATREQRELCQCGKIYGLALSPDGKHLVTERALGANQWELALIPVAGGPVRGVGSYTGEDGTQGRPIFLPDGRSVLTRRTISSHSELLKIDIVTGKVESTGLIHEGITGVQIDAARGKLYFHGTVPDVEFWTTESIIPTR